MQNPWNFRLHTISRFRFFPKLPTLPHCRWKLTNLQPAFRVQLCTIYRPYRQLHFLLFDHECLRKDKDTFLRKTYFFTKWKIFVQTVCILFCRKPITNIYHFIALEKTNRIKKSRIKNIESEKSYSCQKKSRKNVGPKMVFRLQ